MLPLLQVIVQSLGMVAPGVSLSNWIDARGRKSLPLDTPDPEIVLPPGDFHLTRPMPDTELNPRYTPDPPLTKPGRYLVAMHLTRD